MLIRRFMQWCATAPSEARAEGTAALARAFAAEEFEGSEQLEAEAALTSLLDDPAPIVRLAMAIELCRTPALPRTLVAGLLADRSDIAAVLLEFSPAPTIAELVDAVAVGDTVVQAAVARRRGLDVRLAAALAEVAGAEACLELCRNASARLPRSTTGRLVERFASHREMRAALAERADLPPAQRYVLARDTARDLAGFARRCGWLAADRAARIAADATEQACVAIAADAPPDNDGGRDLADLVNALRWQGALTPALLLRAVLCGGSAIFEAALAELAGLPLARVAGLVRHGRGLGFRSLFDRAGLPPRLRPVFVAALEAAPSGGEAGHLQRRRIVAALKACDRAGEDVASAASLLRRLDAEAARIDARAFARSARSEAVVYLLPRPTSSDRHWPLPTAA